MVTGNANALVGVQQDLNVVVDEVRFDDNVLTENNVIDSFDKNQQVDVVVRFTAQVDVSDLEVEVSLKGFDQKQDLIDSTDSTMNVKAGNKYTEKFSLDLPYKLDKGNYALYVNFYTKTGSFSKKYILNIDAEPHSLIVTDVLFSPSSTVQAGRSILTTVRVRNIGEQDQDSIKVTVSVPGLGIMASDYVEELNDEESTLSEELWLLVPKCAKAGTYDAYVTVEYRDGDEKVSTSRQITVVESGECPLATGVQSQDKTVLTVGATAQDVVKGTAGAIYPITLTNAGNQAKTYVVNVDGYAAWGKVSVSPSNVLVLQPGESKTAYVYVTALDTANAGQQMFTVSVTSGSETLKQFAMTANVVAGQQKTDNWSSVKRGLEIGLIVLVVLLVILGLIIAFNKLRGNEEEKEEEEGETYY